MKNLTISLVLVMSSFSLTCLADGLVEVEEYSYGMSLDVEQVMSVKAPKADVTSSCNSVEEVMTYKDSEGQEHKLKYLVLPTGCGNG